MIYEINLYSFIIFSVAIIYNNTFLVEKGYHVQSSVAEKHIQTSEFQPKPTAVKTSTTRRLLPGPDLNNER
jgi:hypothetical protein